MSSDVSLPNRTESRYGMADCGEFIEALAGRFRPISFSDKNFVQTIYFNNDDHEVPFGTSLKLRRYVSDPTQPVLSGDGYFLEIKRGRDKQKDKVRIGLDIEGARQYVNVMSPGMAEPLRPYMAVVYNRQHFVPSDGSQARLTVDGGMRYFFFRDDGAEPMGEEAAVSRVELKESSQNNASMFVKDMLSGFGAVPIVSKKCKGHYFVNEYHVGYKGKKFHRELPETEVEAKLGATGEMSFRQIKELFRTGHLSFVLLEHFPFTVESGSIQRYYRHNGRVFKVSYKEGGATRVEKGIKVVLDDPLHLGCVVRRTEKKDIAVPFDSPIITSEYRELYKMKKAFYVRNMVTNRFYHLSVDCCTGLGDPLYQMEIEYTGTFGEIIRAGNAQDDVVKDIATIAAAAMSIDSALKPTQLTKEEWTKI